jgi:predicted amidohydrolase
MEPFLKISAIQSSLTWEDIDSNLAAFEKKISELSDNTDLIVLPEMFSTGFSMNPEKLAEKPDGKTTGWMQAMAKQANSVLTGSIIVEEEGKFFNRMIWMQPDGNYFTYDKKHLFSIAGENTVYTAGKKKLIIDLKGWKVCPLICYDLRFPVWCRNSYKANEYEYDLLIFVANWPQVRGHPWKTLLSARAMENLSYVIGVNRVGEDGNKIPHTGDTRIIDPKGNVISQASPNAEFTCRATLDAALLKNFRNKFSIGPEWDHFIITDQPKN